MIPVDLLEKYNAQLKEFREGEYLFRINELPRYYFQIEKGDVKIHNINDQGKEFIQSIFSEKRGVGEPALLGNYNYPTNCVTLNKCKIWQLTKRDFFNLLKENSKIHFNISREISRRLYYKAIISTEISIENPEHKILTLIDYLKNNVYSVKNEYEYQVELSRQQIADLIGLRVETVIRTIKKLEEKNEIKLIKHKIYR
ncbi:Crp/Fnr family transcriptional regulator [Flavobacteriales bacterium]|nr:Crp/Fnr family transcriptional regulator [Flavobacteriales bacterium]